MDAACLLKEIRGDDLEFVESVREWRDVISAKSMKGYEALFTKTSRYFESRLDEAKNVK
jgi:hypothetical protein